MVTAAALSNPRVTIFAGQIAITRRLYPIGYMTPGGESFYMGLARLQKKNRGHYKCISTAHTKPAYSLNENEVKQKKKRERERERARERKRERKPQ